MSRSNVAACGEVLSKLLVRHEINSSSDPSRTLKYLKQLKQLFCFLTVISFSFNLLINYLTIITVNRSIYFFNFKGREPISTCSGAIHFKISVVVIS